MRYETAGIIREVMGGNMDTGAGKAEHPLLWEHNGFLGQNQNINNMDMYVQYRIQYIRLFLKTLKSKQWSRWIKCAATWYFNYNDEKEILFQSQSR